MRRERAIRSVSDTGNETARLATLRQYNILDTAPEAAFDALTRLAAHFCATPIAVISLIDRNRQWFKSKVGWEADEVPRDVALFCAQTILQPDFYVVPDAKADEYFVNTPLVVADPPVRFYAGVPLTSSEGHALGTLCVIDHVARNLNSEQVDALCALAREVMILLEMRRRGS